MRALSSTCRSRNGAILSRCFISTTTPRGSGRTRNWLSSAKWRSARASSSREGRRNWICAISRFHWRGRGREEERTAERDRVWRNSRDLLVTVGDDGIFRGINPASKDILGYEPGEMIG